MTFVAGLLLASALLSSALGYFGPACPAPKWRRFTFRPDGSVKCYLTSSGDGNVVLARINHWCANVHPEAYPALLENQEVVDFIREHVLPDHDWYNVGYSSHKNKIIRNYLAEEVLTNFIVIHDSNPGDVLKLSKDGLKFSAVQSNAAIVCSIDVVPMEVLPYKPPKLYLDSDCPEGWERKDFDYASKCFKIYTSKSVYRCRLTEICNDHHESAMPASIRTNEEKWYLKDMSRERMLYTGMHISCDPYRQTDVLGRIQFIQVNGEPVPTNVADAIDNYKSDDHYSEGYFHESLLGNFYFGFGNIEDLPDHVFNVPVLCEIFLPEKPKENSCRRDFSLINDHNLCFSDHIFAFNTTFSKR